MITSANFTGTVKNSKRGTEFKFKPQGIETQPYFKFSIMQTFFKVFGEEKGMELFREYLKQKHPNFFKNEKRDLRKDVGKNYFGRTGNN